ncbi:beta-glucosidase 13-like [Chenopodium quinoa]|uniref:beta-glucosidase 13-like n=1 Tax=Chenopodium quinoa TaxID=63459 RepID=UPI000B797831|nr:beta-glucosidase 13-like [Chenopodium quinoa]
MALLHSAPSHTLHYSITKLNLKNPSPFVSKTSFTSRKLHFREPSFGATKISCRLIPKIVQDGVNTVVNPVISIVDGLQPATYTPPKDDLKKEDFPADFIFGASTSALQTEGRGDEGGRGKSTWDFMIEAEKGHKAVDSYNLYKEDVKILKETGLNSYRFSIAWPRILPNGTVESGINQEGIDFYNNFIDELVANGITPIVTLFHFDLPVPLQKQYFGFMRPNVVEQFTEFADLCFEKFGDRVKYWGTINEPYVFGAYGYKMGLPSDLQKDPRGSFIATHHIILAHASAAKLYKDKYQKSQKGKIGISLPCKWFMPHSTDPKDFAASKMQLDFTLGWYMDPLIRGDYPETMKKNVKGLPEFTKAEKQLIKGAFDYIGINYYTSRFVEHTCTVDPMAGNITINFNEQIADDEGNLVGLQAKGQADIYIRPDGLKNLLLYIKEEYGNPEVYVTENGVPDKPTITSSIQDLIAQGKTEELAAALDDDYRIQHTQDHLIAVREARSEGANVKGYIVWSLMDNMEVGAGYDVRFGLNFTDYFDNHKRYPKKSARWYADFLNADGTKDSLN